MTKRYPVHKVLQSERVPLKVRVGWGLGGLADNYIMNVLNAVFLVLYVQYFKMPPMLAGVALAIPRFFDAVTDPLVGNISDNTRSRWGRRRPYIAVGAVLSAFLLPLFWMPPGLGTVSSAEWWRNIPFLYVVTLGLLYALAYTIYVVPYTALGFELTNDYDERTRVLAWRMYVGLLGSLTVPLVYRLCQLDSFGNEGRGVVIVSMGVSLVIIASGLVPAWLCKERHDVQRQASIPFLQAVKVTLTNRPFLIVTVAYVIIIVGLFSSLSLLSFLNIYSICGGNKDFAGLLIAARGILVAVAAYGSMFIASAIASRTGKKTAMIICLSIAFFGTALDWFALDPRWPLAQLLTAIVSGLGFQGCWLMISSMIADICDEDELQTGMRREGMFGAVNGFALKVALSVTALLGGWLLQTSGFDAASIDRFESETVVRVIAPPRSWETADAEFAAATKIFEGAANRFELVADDKSAADEGGRWQALQRLIRGESVYYRWGDFEKDVRNYLTEVEKFSGRADSAMQVELAAYVQSVRKNFFPVLERQKSISETMKRQVVMFLCGGLLFAIILYFFYPITRKRAEETRRILDERRRT